MYGLPDDLKLNFFVGVTLEDVVVDVSSIYLKFTNNITINVESAVYFKYTIAGEGGKLLKELVCHKVIKASKQGHGNLGLEFDNSEKVLILELDYPFESYTMQTPEGLVVV